MRFDVERSDGLPRPVPMRGRWNTKSWFRTKIGVFALFLLSVLAFLSYSHTSPQQAMARIWEKPLKEGEYDWRMDIPNIAHFVRQINRDSEYNAKGPFRVEFRHLLSYYSCSMYLNPDKIYFWTDTPDNLLQEARENGDIYTKALFRIPNLVFKHVAFPNKTSSGFPINQYAHRSDFVRTEVMARFGGVYLDDDAWVLRDLAPLRRAGFDNVFSLDDGPRIAQAAFMSKPGNELMQAFARYQQIYFNGEWLRASNDLVTSLMVHFARKDGFRTSLVLEKAAFFDGYWIGDALNMYYEIHDDDVGTFRESGTQPPTIENFEYDFDWRWRKDWRRSWVVHGWSNEFRARKAAWMFKEFKAFSPAYVWSRRSNLGRALYPALVHMVETGFLDLKPEDLRAPLAQPKDYLPPPPTARL